MPSTCRLRINHWRQAEPLFAELRAIKNFPFLELRTRDGDLYRPVWDYQSMLARLRRASWTRRISVAPSVAKLTFHVALLNLKPKRKPAALCGRVTFFVQSGTPRSCGVMDASARAEAWNVALPHTATPSWLPCPPLSILHHDLHPPADLSQNR